MSKKEVLENEMVKLYQEGYSAKDICDRFNVSSFRTRHVLRRAGFDTRTYRKISDNNKEKILLLVKSGYSYNQIARLLQCSFHLVREVVEGAGMIGYAPKNYPPVELNIKESEVSEDVIKELEELYCSGEYGLSKCAALAKASDNDFIWFVYYLSPETQTLHDNSVKSYIKNLHVSGIPWTAISKKMDISPSIVKGIINEPVHIKHMWK